MAESTIIYGLLSYKKVVLFVSCAELGSDTLSVIINKLNNRRVEANSWLFFIKKL